MATCVYQQQSRIRRDRSAIFFPSTPTQKIYEEIYTGTKIEGRTVLNKLLKRVEPGDTIVFDEVSRMSRDADAGVERYKELYHKGVILEFIKNPQVNTETYKSSIQQALNTDIIKTGDEATDEFMKQIIEALNKYILTLAEKQIRYAFGVAQSEVDFLRKRTCEGIKVAKSKGKRVGMPKGSHYETKKSMQKKKEILKYNKRFGGSLNDKETIKLIGITSNTFYKYRNELLEEMDKENV